MATEYPYVLTTSKIAVILDKIVRTGVPAKASKQWLHQVGLKSSYDQRLLPLLKFIGFVDGGGTPTELWRQYRGANSRAVLGAAIRAAYKALYDTYPNADSEPTTNLVNVVRSTTGLAEETSARVVQTFKALVQLADVPSESAAVPSEPNATPPSPRRSLQLTARRRTYPPSQSFST